MLTGCKDRREEVCGIWDWGTYTVHFDTDDSWGATDKQHSSFEKMGGTWSLDGDNLILTYAGSADPEAPESVFILSKDGAHLDAETAAVGTMTKSQRASVESSR